MTTLQAAMATLQNGGGQPAWTLSNNATTPSIVPQPARVQLGGTTQIINAFNAEGQPVTIAINPNGTHTVLNTSQLQQAQRLPTLRQANNTAMPAARLVAAPAGTRLLQLPNGDIIQTAAQGVSIQQAQPGLYKVVQQNGLQQGGRIVLQQAAPSVNVQPVQRLVAANTLNGTANGLGMKPNVQAITIRPGSVANVLATQPAGNVQVARPLIQTAARPNTVTTYNPTTGLFATNVAAPSVLQQNNGQVQLAQGIQQLQLPADATRAVLQQPSMQQQVKDTVAQQRQQQLLASLRAQLYSVQGNNATNTLPVVLKSAQPQLLNLHVTNQQDSAATAQQITALQSLLAAQQQQQQQAQLAQALLANQQQQQQLKNALGLDNAILLNSLTPQQQQALLGSIASSASTGRASVGLAGQNVTDLGHAAHNASNGNLLANLAQQNDAISTHTASTDTLAGINHLLNDQTLLNGGHLKMASLGSANGRASPQVQLNQKAADMPGDIHQQQQQQCQESMHTILCSIGIELARHGFTVAQAIEANWLGVLSASDVAVLREAYHAEERRLAAEARNGTSGAASVVHNSRSSPANSIGSSGFPAPGSRNGNSLLAGEESGSRGGTATPSIGNPAPPRITEIDDACFSAFAYGFFGSTDGNNCPLEPNMLMPLESGAVSPCSSSHNNNNNNNNPHADQMMACGLGGSALSKGSHASNGHGAPSRTPSWPAHNEDNGFKAPSPSIAAFSDVLCNAGAPTVHMNHNLKSNNNNASVNTNNGGSNDDTSLGNSQELVARIANLDLGCGFY